MFNKAKRSGKGVLVTEVEFVVKRPKVSKKDEQEVVPPMLMGVLSAVLPVIVEKGLDWLGKLLEKRVADYSGTSSAMGVEELYYSTEEGDETKFNIDAVTFRNKRSDVNDPDLEAKFLVRTATDWTAFRLELEHLIFNATSAKKIKENRKDILFTGVLELPYQDLESEEDRENAKFGAFQVAVRDVALGTDQTFNPLPTTQWIPLPANEDPAKRGKNRKALTRPFSLLMTAVEAEEAGDLLLLARDLLAESKDTLKEQLTDLIKDALSSDDEKK